LVGRERLTHWPRTFWERLAGRLVRPSKRLRTRPVREV
jgi:hypothetical protein